MTDRIAATEEQIRRVHPEAYVRDILAIQPGPGERVPLDADTVMSEGSREAALRSAGGAVMAVDAAVAVRIDCSSSARSNIPTTKPFRLRRRSGIVVRDVPLTNTGTLTRTAWMPPFRS